MLAVKKAQRRYLFTSAFPEGSVCCCSTYVLRDTRLHILVGFKSAELLDSFESLLVLHPLRSTSAVRGAIFASHAKLLTSFAWRASTAFHLALVAQVAS